MKRTWIVASLALASGCFDEGGNEVQLKSAETMAEGLLSFADIHNNLTTDPAAAGVALTAFIKTPVAANNLVSAPFMLGDIDEEVAHAIVEAPTPVPDCLQTMGPAGCDSLEGTECVAGPFVFNGTASRMCSPCENVTGVCTYDWNMRINFTGPTFLLDVNTRGPAMVSPDMVHFATYWEFALTLTNGGRQAGKLKITSCTDATVKPGPPRRLVNAEFIVEDQTRPVQSGNCAKVNFDANGNVSTRGPGTGNACVCGTN